VTGDGESLQGGAFDDREEAPLSSVDSTSRVPGSCGAPPPWEGMAWIPGGAFLMGSDRRYPEEAPAHQVAVDGFWMDRCAVTNSEFRRFVEGTGSLRS
jgi:formylglycine-generating enzyme required for sulfatase activity